MGINKYFMENFGEYKAMRRFIHSNPESGTDTIKTAEFVKSRLKNLGIKYSDIGINSVIAEIDGVKLGKTIALRCDMDALNIAEENSFDYKSQNKGLMHACGHDGHTTILIAVADYLVKNNNFEGKVLLIFQSGEEGFDGALKIIEDSLFDKFKIDSIFGFHNWPGFEEGKVIIHPGSCMASEDRFYVRVRGKSGHASAPSGCIEPFAAVADIIKGCQTIIPRKILPSKKAVLSITKVIGGSADNIIPDYVDITGNVRACNDEVQDTIEASVKDIVFGVEKIYGLKADIDYKRKHPVLTNSYIEPAIDAALDSVGADNLIKNPDSVMGSEDFALYLKYTKGCFIWIGNGVDSKVLHNSCYDFNDEIIPKAASFLVSLVNKVLK